MIIPINYNLAVANIFVAATNMYQLSRVFKAGSAEKAPQGAAVGAGLVDALEEKTTD